MTAKRFDYPGQVVLVLDVAVIVTFVRVRRGFYLPNPAIEVEMGDQWLNLYDIIHLDALEQERDDTRLQSAIRHIRILGSGAQLGAREPDGDFVPGEF